ncbi:MAG: 4Fe-4S binding protein [Desulfobacteraceae bacterium]|nr:4Fe-4S binding protein [Desulfobacteraceae bacterium]
MHRLRRTVQGGFALFCLWAGYRFYLFSRWAAGRSPAYVPRPPSVEAFLPISALVSLKRLVLTGRFDPIHPAGLTIFLAALAMGLLLRKGFCGWICPVGLLSDILAAAGRRLRLLRQPPAWLAHPLLALKYLLLALFAFAILARMDLAAIESFQLSPYNLVVDARMLAFFLAPSAASLWVMGGLVGASLLLRSFWCRFLCPYGALLGLLALAGPVAVHRNPGKCLDCRKCERVCPAALPVSRKETVRSPECIGCTECVAACPAPDCLTVKAGRRPLPPLALPLAVLGVFFAFWVWAVLSGHWQTQVPLPLLQKIYALALTGVAHP